MLTVDSNNRFRALEEMMAREWERVLSGSPMVRALMNGCSDRRLYALYLVETFHCISHNARTQAAVLQSLKGSDARTLQYIKFCLRSALDEVGHELIAYQDLKNLGFPIPMHELPKPNPTTEVLIQYLYKIALTGNPAQRLGYNYWTQDSFRFFGNVMIQTAKSMDLRPEMMTFLREKGAIKDSRFQQTRAGIAAAAQTDEDWAAIAQVMARSMRLTGLMLDEVYIEYQKVLSGRSHWNPIFAKYTPFRQ